MKILCSDPPSSADTIAGNKDLLTEILLRLPPKPLVRFRSVSKDWCSLISSPRFCHRHARLSPAPKISGIFFRKSAADFHYLSLNSDNLSPNPFKFLDFAQDPAGIRILQSCNGLLLCSSFFKIGFTRNYYVCNPTTGRFSTIPPIIGDVSAVVSGFNLAFEPSKSPYYKLICVRSAAGSVGCHQIEIYSSETGDWKLCGSPFVAPFDMVFNNGVFCNGSIHWISPTGSPMYFDVSNERIGMLPTVPIVEQQSTRRFRYFGESGGHLHLIEIYGPRTTQFRVLEMEKDYSKWVVRYQIDFDSLVSAYPEMVLNYLDPHDSCYYAFIILFLIREEKEEDSSLLLHIPDKIISFNIRKKTFRELCHLSGNSSVNGKGRHSMQFGWLDAYQYFESLACP
ncbi:hypothetical protein SLA2020_517380 [Shorea laevis]